MRTRTGTMRVGVCLIAVTLVAAACTGGDGAGRKLKDFDLSGVSLTVGSKRFVEQYVLGHIAIQALTAAGADVTDRTGLDGSRAARDALMGGSIDLYPEYNGTCWTAFFTEDERPGNSDELTNRCAEFDRSENGIAWVGRAPLNDTYGFAVAPALAAQEGAFDLAAMAAYMADHSEARMCAAREFIDRADGLALFEAATGYVVPEEQLVLLDLASIYRETAADRCDFGEIFTTDGRLGALDLALVDDGDVFFIYNPSLTVRAEVLEEHSAIGEIAEMILAPLDDATITELNRQVAVEGRDPAVVAWGYLESQGLIDDAVSGRGPQERPVDVTGAESTGDRDPSVVALQEDLEALGYYVGPISGVYDEATTAAVTALQVAADLEPDGTYGSETAAVVGALLGRTDQQSILVLQEALTVLGYYDGLLDGIYGKGTTEAIKQVQSNAGLPVDGEYSPETAEAVLAEYRAASPDPVSVVEPVVSPVEGPVDSGPDFLQRGDEGEEIASLQRRLIELGYRPGEPDGYYGEATAAAVLAFQKHEGLNRDAQAGPEVLAALNEPRGEGTLDGYPTPRIEVDLVRQIAYVVLESETIVLNVSTGSGEVYADAAGRETLAFTPTGAYAVERRIDGIREAPLGSLYKPLYFYEGWAVHGAASVPAYPASHGCVRTHNWDQDWLTAQVDVGATVIIYDDLRDPDAATPVEAQAGF